ncbi:MAG: tRNA (adenosine(37)-N6)-threonylcarbamoyltransferase complex transferase subunit TsaD [Deltaproteobacteria bacterium]|nr:tRNA (adenosine(37)-N6)-threonylcarbamoyltransferase complex transferase subunit TsaD [Deltaproteobacteria bacterium]
MIVLSELKPPAMKLRRQVVADGRLILSSVVSSQIAVHSPYGGVVPELASRKHIEAIVPVVCQALGAGGILRAGIEAVAVTQGPGLIGSLLVGFSFAKAFAMVRDIPWIGVSHLEGHINSVFLEPDPPAFPSTALLASGGHTRIDHVTSHTQFDLMGQTRDHAAGEAFDKVAKMLGLGLSGGRHHLETGPRGGAGTNRLSTDRYLDRSSFDFSFSGLKTAVGRYIHDHSRDLPERLADIAAGFQEAVVEVLVNKVIAAAVFKRCYRIALVGGVAANRRLREKISLEAPRKGYFGLSARSRPLRGQ